MTPKQNIIIIGAGLSGLYAASLLQTRFNVIVLEARDRLGGRILTQEGHDLGPSWIWPHQKNILSLIDELGLELFSQYTKGDALYDAPGGVQRFNSPSSAPSSRVKGGLIKVIDELVTKSPINMIHLNEEVLSIRDSSNGLEVTTYTNQYQADFVLSTLSPRLACENISYTPPLDEATKSTLLQTPTWMGQSAKCVVEFKEAFWRDEGLSGFIFSPIGPLGEIHDASIADKPALFGFLQTNASLTNVEDDVRKQIKRLFKDKAELITNIYFIDWRKEKFSSTTHDHKSLKEHPSYGLTLTHFDNKLFFIGTETAYDNGGYLEGAIISAKKIAQRLQHTLAL